MRLSTSWLSWVMVALVFMSLCSNVFCGEIIDKAKLNDDLIEAVAKDNLVLVKELIDKGADVNARNREITKKSFAFAQQYGGVDIMISMSTQAKAKNIPMKENSTALMYASAFGSLEVVKFLIAKGADINAVNYVNGTALMVASQSGNIEVVKVLLKNGAKVDIINRDGMTASKLAAKFNHMEVAFALENQSTQNDTTTDNTRTRTQIRLHGMGMDANPVIIGPVSLGAFGLDLSSPMEFEGDILFFEHKFDGNSQSFGNVVKLYSGMSKDQVSEKCKSSNVPINIISENEWRVGTGTILFREGKLFAGTMKP